MSHRGRLAGWQRARLVASAVIVVMTVSGCAGVPNSVSVDVECASGYELWADAMGQVDLGEHVGLVVSGTTIKRDYQGASYVLTPPADTRHGAGLDGGLEVGDQFEHPTIGRFALTQVGKRDGFGSTGGYAVFCFQPAEGFEVNENLTPWQER